MSRDEINLPNAAYSEAEQAAREITQNNADEYGRAGMHVGALWGAVGELNTVLADVVTMHGEDDPCARRIRERIVDLTQGRPGIARGCVDKDGVTDLRGAAQLASELDSPIAYPLREVLRELTVRAHEGWGWESFRLREAVSDLAKAVLRATGGAS